MKKFCVFLAMLLLSVLAGCGKADGKEKNRFSVDEDGAITVTVVESFERDYYDKKELEKVVETAIESYNKTAGKESVELKNCRVGKDVARVTIWYETGGDYTAFNQTGIFNGPVSQVEAAGYDKMSELYGDDGQKIPIFNLIVAEEDLNVAVLKEDCILETSGKILYVSKNVTIEGRKSADVTADDKNFALVVYK